MIRFPDRKPSVATSEAMLIASNEGGLTEHVERCKGALSKTTGHKEIELTENGEQAIFLTLSTITGGVLVPDQGIWKGTTEQCETLGIAVEKIPTNFGLVEPFALENSIEEFNPSACILTSFAGYIAEQNLRALHRICNDFDVLLIEDASSSIGDRNLAKAKNADVVLASARAPKILNLPAGGFISSNDVVLMERVKKLNEEFIPDISVCAGIREELKSAQTTIDKLSQLSEKLKKRAEGVLHRKKRGVCFGVLSENPKSLSKAALKKGLKTVEGRSILTPCPRIDRFLEKGVTIELKKLSPDYVGNGEAEFILKALEPESLF
jgi:hypothetical protein